VFAGRQILPGLDLAHAYGQPTLMQVGCSCGVA